ncbi:putative RNA-directed DNA polymerase [Dioscorea sansibarensis]
MIILYVRVVHLGNDIEMPFQKGVLGEPKSPLNCRMTWVYFIEHKSEVLFIFKKFKLLVESQSGYYLKILRIDRGASYAPQQNGVAKGKIGAL